MACDLTWLGHGSWSIRCDKHSILLDPFLDDSPVAPLKAADVDADFILVSHGHYDHVADVAAIARRTGAQVISNFEIAQWFSSQHQVKHTLGMNLGGAAELPFGRVKLTLAHHSSQLPDGSYGGNPAGFLLSLPQGRIYFACDTALFSDMQTIGAAGIELAVLPIGDLFTMGPDDSLEAIRWIRPQRVAPSHYNTWPPIAQDAQRWAARVRSETSAEPVVLEPGGTLRL
jgi:L-ascorbate metabolism protein UlaG (beta-lactamase superfamily)